MNASVLRGLCVAVLLSLAAVTHARAAWRATVATETDSGVNIEVVSPFDYTTPDGYFPLSVTINNTSGAAHTWDIVCDSDDSSGYGGTKRISSDSLHVESGHSGRIIVLATMSSAYNGYYRQNHNLRVEGYGTSGFPAPLPAFNASPRGVSDRPVLGMSEALATPIWAGLTKRYADTGQELLGTPVDLSLLVGDWRSLIALDALWITDAEYTALDAARRNAVHDWVRLGGSIHVCMQNTDLPLRADFRLAETGTSAQFGMGMVVVEPWDGQPLPLTRVTLADPNSSHHGAASSHPADEWPLSRAVGMISLNAPLLIAFIVVFALVVGPINLFVFARAGRRHRLFWTTPAISVAASVLLVVFILLQDGFGGSGQRRMICLLVPDEQKTVIVQEQVARTGVLFARQFRTAEDVVLTPMQVGSGITRSYEQSGRLYSGDWFVNRSVQAHRLVAVVPSRAAVQLVNPEAVQAGQPPILTSNVAATLQSVFYSDPSGTGWRGGTLRTGERITLRSDPPFPPVDFSEGSPYLSWLKSQADNHEGYFYAEADSGPFLETLPSIRWNKQRVFYCGLVVPAP